MSSALILLTGIFTDRLGGTGCIVYGNVIYTIGSIFIAGAAELRSYKFMIVGRVIASFGDIATQVAQYKVFSSWFPPSAGFASTLGFELGIKKVRLWNLFWENEKEGCCFADDGDVQIGGFVGKSTANIIAKVRTTNTSAFHFSRNQEEGLTDVNTEVRLLKRLLDNGRHEPLHQPRHNPPFPPSTLLLIALLFHRRPLDRRKAHREKQKSRL